MSMYEILSELRRKEEAKAWTEIDFPISLKEALERLTKVELDEIRKTYDFKGISSLNKADLIDKLVDLIPKHISRTLKWLDEERYSLIEKIIHNKGLLKVDGFDIKKIRFYKRSALVFTGSLDGKKVLFIPGEIIDAIKEAMDNNTRRWILKGHSPNMIRQSNQENLQPLQDDKNNNNLYSIKTKEKIGRNDPCPCGSGLKYKKCCGR